MKIAILLTCHNRREKTEKSLSSLKNALLSFNNTHFSNIIDLEIFLTDDGCTDGTAEKMQAIVDYCPLNIIKGDGDLFWAGGMRFCWREAMKRHSEWNYYLLINDDTEMMENMFDEMFNAEKYAVDHYGQEGIISGITCSTDDSTKPTYGGEVWSNRLLGTTRRLAPNGKPQMCDFTNANILLVPTKVVDKIGIFIDGFQHGKADYDYSNTARNVGIPVVLTANFCGKCDYDHIDEHAVAKKVMAMSLSERKRYFNTPIHSIKDYLLLVRRTSPLRYPLVWFGRKLNLYLPRLYYRLSLRRF